MKRSKEFMDSLGNQAWSDDIGILIHAIEYDSPNQDGYPYIEYVTKYGISIDGMVNSFECRLFPLAETLDLISDYIEYLNSDESYKVPSRQFEKEREVERLEALKKTLSESHETQQGAA